MVSMSCWSYVAPSSVSSVYYDKICIKFVSHHLLLYAVYICQKSLNFTYAFKCYQQNCSCLHFTWPTLYIQSMYIKCQHDTILWKYVVVALRVLTYTVCMAARSSQVLVCRHEMKTNCQSIGNIPPRSETTWTNNAFAIISNSHWREFVGLG